MSARRSLPHEAHPVKRLATLALVAACSAAPAAEPRSVSGVYPHLAMFNDEGECGTGAVVPWADRLWVVTYGPHLPFGSSDKLYEITPDLTQTVRPESVGGTPANRMIHAESNQLVIGPYFIDAGRKVRVIPPKLMPGRLTGTARHLSDPAGKVYFATMEEGLYEVDVKTLAVTGLIRDGNGTGKPGQTAVERPAALASGLPGYHGKGLYAGQGRLVYANNGEQSAAALTDPTIPSGALAEWTGRGDWSLVRRNQFTEVTGPGGLRGNADATADPVWSVGWDAKSLILMVASGGKWHAYRLPKASHCYDGAHGWNTEWPRVREVGDGDLLMTMHGTFWRFPKGFTPANSAGIAPRSTYLKVVGDFCRWGDRLVLGCDDTAKSEFLNKRKAKGDLAAPGQSQSNLWFVAPDTLDHLGPPLGRGAAWLDEPVKAHAPSEPYLFAGYTHRSLHLTHDGDGPATFAVEVDAKGDGTWAKLRTVDVPAKGYAWVDFPAGEKGVWVRVVASNDCPKATAMFHYRNADGRKPEADAIFAGVGPTGEKPGSGGLLHARGANSRTLRVVAKNAGGDLGAYDLNDKLELAPANDPAGAAWTAKNAAVPKDVLTVDAASILYADGKGRWRLPKGDPALDKPGPLGAERVCREVCTERDLFNAGGTFYELPAENAGGFAKVRPVCTHNRRITDYASYRGLLVLSGLTADAAGDHVVRSADGKCALWVGAVDDLWKFGKPRGTGGPWKDSAVAANVPSDPYLFAGYDCRTLTLSHAATEPVNVRVEVDITGTGKWVPYRTFAVPAGSPVTHAFEPGYGGYWLRAVADRACTATATLVYD